MATSIELKDLCHIEFWQLIQGVNWEIIKQYTESHLKHQRHGCIRLKKIKTDWS